MKKNTFQELAKRPVSAQETLEVVRASFKNWRVYGPWLVAALILWGISWATLLAALERDKREAEVAGLAEAATLSRAYADQVSRTMDALDQSLRHVRYEWILANGKLRLDEMAKQGLFTPVTTSFLAITDRNGAVRTSTIAAAGELNLKDRPYFVSQMSSTADTLFIDRPTIGRVSKRKVIQLSRRLWDGDGNFDGVVLISVTPSYFTQHFDVATFGKNGYLGIVGEDQVFRASRIGQTAADENGAAWTRTLQFSAAGGSAWFEGKEWFVDKHNRFVGWKKVAGYPLIAVAGLDEDVTLAAYRSARADTMRRAFLTTLGFALVTMGGIAFSMRLAWRKRQMELIQSTYRMATEGSSEGFFILGALRNSLGGIDDFEVIDCNQNGAEFCRQRRESIIGRRFSSLYREDTHERIIVGLHEAMRNGQFEGELEFRRGDADHARWIHMKAVRSDSKLAITLRDISNAKAHVEELEHRGNHDSLTGLPNRHWLQSYLPKAIEYASENDLGLALLFIDLDAFKYVNDTMGHAAGDELLRHVAHRLKEAVRPNDNVVRIGGDEFIVILENNVRPEDAGQIATRVLTAFEPPFKLLQGVYKVGTSIGISLFPQDGKNAAELLQNSDVAMYSVKTSGKGGFRFYDPQFFNELRARLEAEADLRRAVEKDEFVMQYQARVDVLTNAVTSFEALVRWEHPTRGLIGPGEFIQIAEETGLIIGLGDLVIRKVCAQLGHWSKNDRQVSPVSINVSSRQFNETDVSEIFSNAIKKYRLDPNLIEIELTESSMIGSSADVVHSLSAIRNLGIKLLIDDFGTGYSSLAQLQLLDFDILKIDQAFTSRLDDNSQARVLFSAIITMAHALGMRVVAEGVETERQVDILRALGCDEMQGFFISVPLPATERQQSLA